MSVLFLILPLAVGLSALAALTFAWAVRRGQFDDLETPAVRLLCDDVATRPEGRPVPEPEPDPELNRRAIHRSHGP